MNEQKNIKFQYTSILFLIVILALITFAPALNNGFVNWDDPIYILNNELVHELSWSNVQQIFSTYILGNYQPLTILHFAVEHHFFGLNPFYYHLSNIILHALNILLVYIFICLLSGRRLIALIVSLLFALHPMRVESVVWVTERKDVLFAFFYLLGLIQYLRYLATNKKDKWHIIATFLCFLLSLLAKPAAISFPLVLLLLDYIKSVKMTYQSLIEKIPFFLFAFAFGIVAIFGTFTPTNEATPVVSTFLGTLNQTITPLDHVKPSQEIFSFWERLLIACHALVQYIVKIVYIDHLSPYYPLPQKINGRLPFDYYMAVFVVLLTSWLLFRWKNKTIRFAMAFFVTTIFFNLPITRIGSVEIADRFTYIPYIGLFTLLAFAFEEAYEYLKLTKPRLKILLNTFFCFLIISYATQSFLYTHIWKNSGRLWSNVIQYYPNDQKGYFNRGNYYYEGKEYQRALKDFRRALALDPTNPWILLNSGNCFLYLGLPELALKSYDRALQIKPGFVKALKNKSIAVQLLEN